MIHLERCTPERPSHSAPAELTHFQARRNGHLLCTYSHVRKWSTEERARRVIAGLFPGEEVVFDERKP